MPDPVATVSARAAGGGATRSGRWWSAYLRDRARSSDGLLTLAFCAVLASPLHSVPRLCSYLLALVTLCRPEIWRAAATTPMAWLAALLLGYLLLTVSWSPAVEPALAARFGIRALVLVCFVVAFADCVRRGAVDRRIGRWFALAAGGAACFAIARYYLRPPEMGRLLGPGQIQNELIAAQAFTVGALFAANALLQRRAEQRGVWALPLAASALATIAAVALTGARTGWLALAVGLGVLAMAHWRPPRFWSLAALWLVALAVVLSVLVWHEGARAWLLPRGTSFRLLIWEQVLVQQVANAPWFGSGLLSDNNLVADLAFLHPHSFYISILQQAGAVGLALFVALIGVTALTLARRLDNPNARLALALLAAGAVVAVFDGHQLIHKVGVVWWLFWLPVAAAVGLTGRATAARRRDQEAEHPSTTD